MKKAILTGIFIFLTLSFAQAQQLYYLGIGARFGKFNSGVTAKYFWDTENGNGMEGQLLASNISNINGYLLKAFYIKQISFHVPFIQLPLDWVMGAGVDAGYFPLEDGRSYYKIVNGNEVPYYKSVYVGGVDATFQLEYQLRKVAPFTIGVDATPFYDFLTPGPEWIDIGFNVRYVIR